MSDYPRVLDEHATIAAALQGRSLARFGDGELKLCRGAGIKSQEAHPGLARELRAILRAPPGGPCLVCIPNIGAVGLSPKELFWRSYRKPGVTRLFAGQPYGSSFITRPDSAPWIDTPLYWGSVRQLWRDRDVVLVRGSGKSLRPGELDGAGRVADLIAPRQHAYSAVDDLFAQLSQEKRLVLLCLGPTATVLAFRLAAVGVQALDLGHLGMFLRKRAEGEPMIVTDEDRAP